MPITNKIGTIHYDKLLSDYAANYQSQRYKFIEDKILSTISVDKQTDKYAIFGARGKYDIADSRRAPGAEANEIDNLRVSDASYDCVEHSLKVKIKYQDVVNANKIIMEEKRKTANVMEALLLGKEKEIADLVFSQANFTHKSSPATKWDVNDWTDVNPRDEVDERKLEISNLIGIEPNTLVLNKTIN